MDNYDIADVLGRYAKLLELYDGNPFKVKSYSNAAFTISKKIHEPLAELSEEQLQQLPSLGKGLAGKVYEIARTGSFEELNDLLSTTPSGVLDMLNIKGIGPKKVAVIWRELGIESVGELLYACQENRLVQAKGFGLKTQEQIIKDIEFKAANGGKFHWAKVEPFSNNIIQGLAAQPFTGKIAATGAYSRYCESVESLNMVMVCSDIPALTGYLKQNGFELRTETPAHLELEYMALLPVYIYFATDETYTYKLFQQTGSEEHLNAIGFATLPETAYADEHAIYEKLQLPYILPELREGLTEIEFAKAGKQEQLIRYEQLKGIIHNHTTYSDGLNTLEEMADYAKTLGYEYLVICDHSQTAAYAGGLQPERVLQQQAEIEVLNLKMAPFKIYKGIESDILGDGSLDYDASILRTFDVVVASIHQNLKMDQDKAHKRLIGAIENPYTTILGHPTGRLLLMRNGYPVDHKYIIDACARNGVAIELNAHPYRLDVDWRWIHYCMEKGVMVSINPDAHEKQGYHDMRYGVNVARKGLLTTDMCLNALSREAFEAWLEKKRR